MGNKLPELELLIFSKNYDILLISESWLSPLIADSLILKKSNYSIFRTDRLSRVGGGVCILYKSHLRLQKVQLPNQFSSLEVLICDLSESHKSTNNYRMILCYRPPNTTDAVNDTFIDFLNWSCLNTSKSIILVGDFNYPQIKWKKGEILTENNKSTEFYNTIKNIGLDQLITFPTHAQNFLDLLLCSDKQKVLNICPAPPFSTSDHESFTFELYFNPTYEQELVSRDFMKSNFSAIETHLSTVCWPLIFSNCCNIQQFYEAFLNVMHTLIELHVPNKTINKFTPKFPKNILNLLSKKRKIWRKYKQNSNFKTAYKNVAKQCKQIISDHYSNQELKLLDKNSSLKSFYSFVNKRLNMNKTIPDILSDNVIASEDLVKANAFNKFFSSTFTVDNNIPIIVPPDPCSVNMPKVKFTDDLIVEAIKKLKPSLAVGPDGLCAYFIKKLCHHLVTPLRSIFEVSYNTGQLPSLWSESIVIPLYKKGNQHSVENFRPISLTCTSCKLLESIFNKFIINHLHTNKILKNNQFGFMKNKSCLTQLLTCKNIYSKSLDEKNSLDIIFLDYAKAFDSVVHSKLLSKLFFSGIKNTNLEWIKKFLLNRTQRVKVGSQLSGKQPVLSGVPQGSVLGPTLFLLFINDIVNIVENSQIMLFADDCKIFNTSVNFENLQKDIDKIVIWSKQNQLTISFPKCSVLYLGHSNPKHVYNIEHDAIADAGATFKDLGVFISSNLSSANHCSYVFSKASKVAALITRSFISQNRQLMCRAFKSYVRPILEYCSQVWNPYTLTDIKKVESVQRRFTKKLFPKNVSYEKRLEILNLESLQYRRVLNDIFLTHKIIYGNLLPIEDFYVFNTKNLTRLSAKEIFYIEKFRLDSRKYDFAVRTAKMWNHLPQNIREIQSFGRFKTVLRSVDLRIFLKPLVT